MKTRKPTRTSARKTTKTSAKRTARKGAAAPAKRTARDGARRTSAATTVKRAAKKAVAKVKKAARTVKKAAAKKLGGAKGGGARKGAAARKLPAQADREHVYELLSDFSTVMLITSEGSGASAKLRARPMNVAALREDSTLTFMTGLDTAKVDEARGSVAHVVAQGRTVFVSLRGRAEVVRDRDRIEAAWKPADKVYFPQGKDDPNICLIVFHPEEAELWDVSGAKGLKFLFDAAKSLLTGEAPRKSDDDTHDVVDLRAAQ